MARTELPSSRHWQFRIDVEGIGWLTVDTPTSPVNTLSREAIVDLSRFVEAFEALAASGELTGVVLLSGKESGFIAGADVSEFDEMADPGVLVAALERAHALFNRIEALKVPMVAAIHGFCLGGGLELALACRYRIAVNADATRIGFPEVNLGIFPGFGGTGRSIRQAGPVDAMQIMLTGKLLRASQARRMGLVDKLVRHRDMLRWEARKAVLQRRDARFINTTIMMTLMGAAVSDGLESGQVISGVGGQYNFVAMAHELPGARSILMLRSTRESGLTASSNIVWSYGHSTIPRHLRDIAITEYGIADLRGRSDKDVIIALLDIADSRFQPELLEKAKRAGKIPRDYQIPPRYLQNTPEKIQARIEKYKKMGLLPDFPLGTEFTEEEIVLGRVLKGLKLRLSTKGDLMKTIVKAMTVGPTPEAAKRYLARLQLDRPASQKDKMIQRLILSELISGGYV